MYYLLVLQRYYTPTARELSRMSGVERAPILHHFAESLAGATTIRAFDQRDRFISSNLTLIDNHSRPWFHVASAMEWLSFRLNLLSHFVFAFSLVLLVTLPEGVINPSKSANTLPNGIRTLPSCSSFFLYRYCWSWSHIWLKSECITSHSDMEHMQCRKQNDLCRKDSPILQNPQ